MKLSSCVSAAALAAAVVSFTAPAMGQVTHVNQLSEAQRSELYCVTDRLEQDSDVFYAVAEAVIYDDPTEEVEAALLDIGETCKERYKWDEPRQQLSMAVGLAGAMIGYFIDELYADGLKQEQLPALDRVLAKLSREELSRFADDIGLEDDAFIDRLDALLKAEKFPSDDDYMIETALLLMQAFVMQSSLIGDWIETYVNKKS